MLSVRVREGLDPGSEHDGLVMGLAKISAGVKSLRMRCETKHPLREQSVGVRGWVRKPCLRCLTQDWRLELDLLPSALSHSPQFGVREWGSRLSLGGQALRVKRCVVNRQVPRRCTRKRGHDSLTTLLCWNVKASSPSVWVRG